MLTILYRSYKELFCLLFCVSEQSLEIVIIKKWEIQNILGTVVIHIYIMKLKVFFIKEESNTQSR